jgi:hypothetical protein
VVLLAAVMHKGIDKNDTKIKPRYNMKTLKKVKTVIFLIIIFQLYVLKIYGQITAGEIPTGMFSLNHNIIISENTVYEFVTDSIDINCDGSNDFSIKLDKGPTSYDGPNSLNMFVTNQLLELCATNSGSTYENANLYDFGDTLECSGSYQWSADTIYLIGNYGCMLCFGPYSTTDSYIAYRLNDGFGTYQYGWIKISFNLVDNGGSTTPITASINEILVACTTNIEIIEDKQNILFPNPANDRLNIVLEEKATLEIINLQGQIVDSKSLTEKVNNLDISNITSGVYTLRIKTDRGIAMRKLIKQ